METLGNSKRVEEVFFQAKPCLKAHVHLLLTQPDLYISTLNFVCDSGTIAVVSTGVKARILVALHATRQHKTVVTFLRHCEVVDIVKGLYILDRNRRVRQLEGRIQSIEKEHPHLVVIQEDHTTQDSEVHVSAKRKGRLKKDVNQHSPTTHKKRHQKVDKYRRAKATLLSLEDACHGTTRSCRVAHEDGATCEIIQSASVSGALARKIRAWTQSCLRPDLLEFTLLAMPLGVWKQLADLVHVSPSDFPLPYFLEEVYRLSDDNEEESSAGETNFVSRMRLFLKEVDASDDQSDVVEQLLGIAQEFPQVYLNYSLIRRYSQLTRNKALMEQFAANAPLESVIWFFEEFHQASKRCQHIVSERLQAHDDTVSSSVKGKLTYGKLVERILTLRRMDIAFADDLLVPMAEERLEQLSASWKLDAVSNKVAIFGDASSSMQNAVEAATIFASMVSVCFDGKLSFFGSDLIPSPHEKPSSVHEALQVCTKVRASGCTNLAAALWPYYEHKVWMDMIVLVTDEEENTRKNGHYFADLLAEYKKEVNPDVALIVVCVGRGDSEFRDSLKTQNIEYKLITVDGARPDHAKFDALLGQLALLCNRPKVVDDTSSLSVAESTKGDGEEFVLVAPLA